MLTVRKMRGAAVGAQAIDRGGTVQRTSADRKRLAYLLAKRYLDIVLSLLALALLWPVLLLVALMIRLDSRGPAVFRQERMGYDWRARRQRPFVMYKFRTMMHNCDQRVHEELIQKWVRGLMNAQREGDLVKLTNDPRITRVGGFLRKTSVDELPQLWNVLKGEMSLVGPRPVPLYEVAEYQPWHRRRLEATPGLTGLWQVKGRGLASMDDMTRLDIQYIERQSMLLDVEILLRTIPAVLSGRGAA